MIQVAHHQLYNPNITMHLFISHDNDTGCHTTNSTILILQCIYLLHMIMIQVAHHQLYNPNITMHLFTSHDNDTGCTPPTLQS